MFQNRGDENPAQKAGTVATNILNVVYNGNFPDGATSTNGTPCIMRVNKYTYETEVVYIEKESSAFVNWNGYRMAVEYNGKLYFACAGFPTSRLLQIDPETNESYTPYVIETSIGVDRMFLSIMSASYCEEQLESGESRVVLRLPAALAPVKLAVMPLVKKDGLPEKAREIIDSLKFHFHCQYDEKDSIGKRYRRQDAIGTPYCVTVDHQTLEDNCVTLRNRDTMQQERVAIAELNNIIADRVSITSLLKGLQ